MITKPKKQESNKPVISFTILEILRDGKAQHLHLSHMNLLQIEIMCENCEWLKHALVLLEW